MTKPSLSRLEENKQPRTKTGNASTLFQQAKAYCQQQQWVNAEKCYAGVLQEASLEKSYTLLRQSAEGLAGLYERSGKTQHAPDKALDDGLKATALLNYALWVRKKELGEENKKDITKDAVCEQLLQRIANLETWFLRKLKQDPSKNLYPYRKSTPQHRKTLHALREHVRKQLDPLAEELTRISKASAKVKTHEERVKVEAGWSQQMQALFVAITSKMKSFVRGLLQECIHTLGNPPCEYAMLGFGSFARGEVTPYSDLEFGFLLPEGKATEQNTQYFRDLTRLLYLKVINLGETILPAMAIPSLQQVNFYDAIVPRGFAFDGQMSRACKTPLGKKTIWLAATAKLVSGYELIGSAKYFLQFQSADWYLKDPLLPGEVANSTWMAGNQKLVSRYQALLHQRKYSKQKLQRLLHVVTLMGDLQKYATKMDELMQAVPRLLSEMATFECG